MNGVDVEAINQEHQEKSFTLSESQLDTTINSESHTTTDSKPMESSKKPVTIRVSFNRIRVIQKRFCSFSESLQNLFLIVLFPCIVE